MLAEKIFVHRTNYARSGIPHRLKAISANDNDGRAFGFSHEQACGRGKFIGNSKDGGVQRLLVAVVRAAQIDKRWNARDTDGHISKSETPRPAKRVADDDRQPFPRALAHRSSEAASRAVRIAWKKRRSVHSGNIGLVHSGVSANKTVMRLDNKHMLAAHNAPRFLQNGFNQPRISF